MLFKGGDDVRKKFITRIEPVKALDQKKKIRVAAYCRVSTFRETQQSSIDNQRWYYEWLAGQHDDWDLVDIYCEAGVSGTHMGNRTELQRLLMDCRRGLIDLVVTKSISRLSRNVTDCLEIVRQLLGMDVYVYFEKENIHTGHMESEFFLSVMSSLAEEESLSIAKNSRWAARKRFENGSFKLSNAPYGYKLEDGNLVILPEEAEIVKLIFQRVTEGVGARRIAQELNDKMIPTKMGGRWHRGTIFHILTNEIFTGDFLMGKNYKDDFYKKHRNYGEYDQFLIEDHHPAIISRELFEKVRQICQARGGYDLEYSHDTTQ